ncbi:MAG: hypothetical protein U0174_10190 [Polyangiaceae bacterium]
MTTKGLVLAGSVLLLAGCASAFTSAKDDFRGGDSASARERLVAIEGETKSWNEKDRAEYALYRGLVHLSLADRDAARPWLERADAMVRASPEALSPENRSRLRVALETSYGVKP